MIEVCSVGEGAPAPARPPGSAVAAEPPARVVERGGVRIRVAAGRVWLSRVGPAGASAWPEVAGLPAGGRPS